MPACKNCGYVIEDLEWDGTTECPRCGLNPHRRFTCADCGRPISQERFESQDSLCQACAEARAEARRSARERVRSEESQQLADEQLEEPYFDEWLMSKGVDLQVPFWLIVLFVPFASWFAGIAYVALGWLSIPHCQTDLAREAANNIVVSGTRMCGYSAIAGIVVAILIVGALTGG